MDTSRYSVLDFGHYIYVNQWNGDKKRFEIFEYTSESYAREQSWKKKRKVLEEDRELRVDWDRVFQKD
jgi:hypothetical protein